MFSQENLGILENISFLSENIGFLENLCFLKSLCFLEIHIENVGSLLSVFKLFLIDIQP